MSSFLERCLSNSNATMDKLRADTAKGSCSDVKHFSAKDSCLTPGQFDLPTEDWSQIDIHKRATKASGTGTGTGTGMDAFLNAVIKSV
jgi:hypothetical protein